MARIEASSGGSPCDWASHSRDALRVRHRGGCDVQPCAWPLALRLTLLRSSSARCRGITAPAGPVSHCLVWRTQRLRAEPVICSTRPYHAHPRAGPPGTALLQAGHRPAADYTGEQLLAVRLCPNRVGRSDLPCGCETGFLPAGGSRLSPAVRSAGWAQMGAWWSCFAPAPTGYRVRPSTGMTGWLDSMLKPSCICNASRNPRRAAGTNPAAPVVSGYSRLIGRGAAMH